MSDTQLLTQRAEMSPAVVLGQGLPTEKNGQPVKYFWADAISAGTYHNHAKRFTLSVDRARMDSWVQTFNRMREQGVDVTVNADHSDKASHARPGCPGSGRLDRRISWPGRSSFGVRTGRV
jgi:hypothetical protein